MKINEVEQAVGITKKNIRFYEQEGLLKPSRSTNGYRDYSPEDIDILRQIRLLRRLDIPIEEIKQMQSGNLTLEDCLHRHLVVLRRRAKNLEAAENFCRNLLTENICLKALPTERLLLEMDELEKGGTKFMNVLKTDRKKRRQGAIIGAASAILFMAVFLGIIIWGVAVDPEFPLVLAFALLLFPAVVIIGTLFALKERLKEIEGGEIDEASKY